jgi:hypothetical protein
MAKAKVFSTRVRSWDLLNDNLRPHLAEMPQVQPLQAELQGFIDQARTLDNEQEDTRSKLRDLIHRRQEVERHKAYAFSSMLQTCDKLCSRVTKTVPLSLTRPTSSTT